MPLAVTLPISPRRKRAASLEHAPPNDTFIKQETSPDTLNTPTAQDIPGLDWVETPESGDSFPSTPSPINKLTRVLPTDGKLHELRISGPEATSSSKLLKAHKSSKVKRTNLVESNLPDNGVIDSEKDYIFPPHLYNSSSAPTTELPRLWRFMGDISPENLKFLDPSDSPPEFSKPNAQNLAALRFAVQNAKHRVRDHPQKIVRVGNERPRESIDLQFKTSNAGLAESDVSAFQKGNTVVRPPLLRQSPIKAQATSQSRGLGHPRTNSELTRSTNKRFTRILHIDSIERLIECPGRCIASKVDFPNIRCLLSVKSTSDTRDRTLKQISELRNPLDLTVSENYIRGLINSFTCEKHHRSIATKQLNALLDQYHDRRAPENKHDFLPEDLASLPVWLAALTKVPKEQTIQHVHIGSQTFQSKASACVPTGTNTVLVKLETPEVRHTTSVVQSTKVCLLHQNKTKSTLYHSKVTSTFVSTQIVDVDFMGSVMAIPEMTSLVEERAKISFVKSVNALEQEFCWFFPELDYSVEHYIRKLMKKTLTPKLEQKEGYIYMYWIVGSFDFVKIGWTGKTTSERLKKWETLCGHQIQEFTGKEKSKVWLPHVSRVEALVHAELRAARLKEPACKKCSEKAKQNRAHKEWFAVSAAHAQRVIDKWSKWMLTGPYVANKLRNDLKDEDIDALCKPLPLSVRDTAAFAALRPLTQTEPPLPLLAAPRVRNLRPTKARQSRAKSAEK